MAVPIAPLRTRGRGAPLSWLIVRYFAYTVLGIGAAWVASFAAFSAACNAGMVYPASWGPAHMDEVAAALRDEGAFDAGALPTAYRYALVSGDGTVLDTDLAGEQLERARGLARAESAESDGTTSELEQIGGGGGVTYGTVALADGTVCVLRCEYLPQFISRELAESLPNPQNLMLAAGCAGSVAATALVARRASRMISRSLAPLSAAAEKVGAQQLDFSVGTTGVREVNEVLAAMDRMRASLAESLEARYRAERRQRDQVAALAHDLKTPLTVVRANTEFLEEELSGDAGLDGPARAELACAARDGAEASERLDAYVRLLIETSRGEAPSERRTVRLGSLLDALAADARALASARGLELAVDADPQAIGAHASLDAEAVTRAAMNLVANAVDHAAGAVRISLGVEPAHGDGEPGGRVRITVADDGEGFSPAALEHGCERFYTDDAARRGGAGAHYGIGLAMAAETARAHGGAVELENIVDRNGRVAGARASLLLPLAERAGGDGAEPDPAGPVSRTRARSARP